MVIDDVGRHVSVNGHVLWRTGHFVWCSRCPVYASKIVRGLATKCCGVVKQPARRTNLAEGRAPNAAKRGRVLAALVRLTVADWLAWRFSGVGQISEADRVVSAPGVLHACLGSEGFVLVDD